MLRFTFVCFVLLSLAGCEESWLTQNVDTFYSYRNVGECDGKYVGRIHTPAVPIKKCWGLITTELMLNISSSNSTVVILEKDLGFNKESEVKHLSATMLEHCNVIDRDNFRCDGLERSDGQFTNTSIIEGRRISSSKVCSLWARYIKPRGWIEDGILDVHDRWWISIAYIAGTIALLFGLAVGLG